MYTNVYYQKRFWWLLLAVAGLLFLHLGAAPVYILDEAKNAQCAREMWHAGAWVVPTFNGDLRTDKPALHYWFMHVAFSMFGDGAWQARFFSAIMGIGTVLITFLFVRKLSTATHAFFSALALALSTHFLFEFRLAVPDPYLIFFTALGLFSALQYLQQKSTWWLLATAASLALATLAKGPVALGLPGIVILLYVVIRKQWWVLTDVRLLLAAVVYTGIAAPWYWAVHQATQGAFTQGFFLEHNLSRFSSEMEGHGGPFFVTILIVLIGMLPFSTHIASLAGLMRRKPMSDLVLFSLLVSLVYILFFTISSTKLPNYPMPCYPFVAVLLGYLLTEILHGNATWKKYTWWVLGIIGLALPIGGFVALGMEPETAPYRWWALGLLVLPVGILLAALRPQSKPGNAIAWLAGTYLLFNTFFLAIAYPLVYQQNPVTLLQPILNKGKNTVVAYKDFNPAFLFNAKNPGFRIQVFTDTAELHKFCSAFSAQNKSPVYIISRTDKLLELNTLPLLEIARKRDLFEIPTTVLLQWKANFEN
ncbi:MAG: glycosyltransferase family 39 protein [Bacteroidetes bacterium]|uniref:ArnT family glycosyltransferase n=1 Tax=Phnomibacter sp. TaxID=2836217 RepID=UPI002FDED969|nr:glycosyltransferase family 39 protein [Bacteroidota bacterium]